MFDGGSRAARAFVVLAIAVWLIGVPERQGRFGAGRRRC